MVGVFGGHSIFWVKILYSGHQLINMRFLEQQFCLKRRFNALEIRAACKDTV